MHCGYNYRSSSRYFFLMNRNLALYFLSFDFSLQWSESVYNIPGADHCQKAGVGLFRLQQRKTAKRKTDVWSSNVSKCVIIIYFKTYLLQSKF